MADPMTWIAAASLVAGTAGSAISLNQQRKAAAQQREDAKKNLQLQAEKAPEVATQDAFSSSVKKYTVPQGIKANIFANANKNRQTQMPNSIGNVGNKTTLG